MKKWVGKFLSIFFKYCAGCGVRVKRNSPLILAQTGKDVVGVNLCETCAENLEYNIQAARNSLVKRGT